MKYECYGFGLHTDKLGISQERSNEELEPRREDVELVTADNYGSHHAKLT